MHAYAIAEDIFLLSIACLLSKELISQSKLRADPLIDSSRVVRALHTDTDTDS